MQLLGLVFDHQQDPSHVGALNQVSKQGSFRLWVQFPFDVGSSFLQGESWWHTRRQEHGLRALLPLSRVLLPFVATSRLVEAG